MRSVFRFLAATFALALVMGCLAEDAPPRSTTTLNAARLPTISPPLALFVLRIAGDELALDADQRGAVIALEQEAEQASRIIDNARYRVTGALLDAVATGRLGGRTASVVDADLVAATRTAAPTLSRAILRLHALLPARSRAYLRQRVTARLAGWARAWTTSVSHDWLDTLDAGAMDAASIEGDAIATARAWCGARVAAVSDALDHGPLTSTHRVELEAQLRSGDALN